MFVPLFFTGGHSEQPLPSRLSTVLRWICMPQSAWLRSSPPDIKLRLPRSSSSRKQQAAMPLLFPLSLEPLWPMPSPGDASASGDQRLHEGVKVQELRDTQSKKSCSHK